MEEVTRQIGPLAVTVTRMDKTLRSLYRNGSDPGGPPGYLETARAEDKDKMAELDEKPRASTERSSPCLRPRCSPPSHPIRKSKKCRPRWCLTIPRRCR